MSDALREYRRLEVAWAIAREQAGGRLCLDEEVMWTERVGDIWRKLTDDEKDLVERVVPPTQGLQLVDRRNALGDTATEREAA